MTARPRKVLRTCAAVLGVCLPTLVAGVLGHAQDKDQNQPQPPPAVSEPAASGPTAGEKFKNVTVLKDLPADKLLPMMKSFSASLGVKCEFCHVITNGKEGFERDDKVPKLIARQMIMMTQTLNKTQRALDNKATCYMCHHGKKMPELAPPAGKKPGQPDSASSASEHPDHNEKDAAPEMQKSNEGPGDE